MRTLQLVFHPFLIYFVILLLECIPVKSPVVLNEFPKTGDNFKSPDNFAVYYYTNKGKYSYTSPECYFRLGNPPFSATYEQGGIKIINAYIDSKIPLLGTMCEEKVVATIVPKKLSFKDKYMSTHYLLDNFSVFSHIFFYMLLAFSILYYYRNSTKKYQRAFVACFIGGGILELVQHYFIEGRTATFDDIVMNTIGSIIAIVAYWAVANYSTFFRAKVLK